MGRILKPEGIRGEAFSRVSCELMLSLGRAAALSLAKTCGHPPVFYLARDPVKPAAALGAALSAGIAAGGGIARDMGCLPACAMALLLSEEDAEAGFSLCADDMPAPNITVRLYAKSGLPMPAEQLDSIEGLMNAPSDTRCGDISPDDGAAERYLKAAAKRLEAESEKPRKSVKIAIDCANGAVSALAERFFGNLGAEPLLLHDRPDGLNINRGCGVGSLEQLSAFVKDNGCEAGFAFDGSGSRCHAVDEGGELLDGDRMLAILCEAKLASQNAPETPLGGVAVTLLTNLGFLRYAKARNIPVYTTQSAPCFVLEMMRGHDLLMGGDGTGYLYFRDLPAADGLMTAARVLEASRQTGKPLSALSGVMEHDPQVSVSVRIPRHWREIWKNDPEITAAIRECEEQLGTDGRLLVRERRGDASIRVLLEGRDFRRINACAFAIAEKIQARTEAG